MAAVANSADRQLGVGVIGAGYIAAAAHVPFLKTIPQARLEAVADVDTQRARQLSEAHGIPHFTNDYRELLSNDRIDVVDVCTPPFTHRSIIHEAAAAGKRIIVEKPLAVELAEALAIRDVLSETGGKLGVVLNLRYMPLVQRIPRVLGAEFGQLTAVTATLHTFPPTSPWIARPPYDEYGVLYDYFPHVIDLVTWALRAVPTRVQCVRRESGRHHSFCVIVDLRLPAGQRCVMLTDLKWTSATSFRLIRFDAERRTLFVDLQDQFCQVTRGHITPPKRLEELLLRMSGLSKRVMQGRMAMRYGGMVYHHALLSDFLSDFGMNRGPKISVVDGVLHTAVIDAAVRSSCEGAPVQIDPQVVS